MAVTPEFGKVQKSCIFHILKSTDSGWPACAFSGFCEIPNERLLSGILPNPAWALTFWDFAKFQVSAWIPGLRKILGERHERLEVKKNKVYLIIFIIQRKRSWRSPPFLAKYFSGVVGGKRNSWPGLVLWVSVENASQNWKHIVRAKENIRWPIVLSSGMLSCGAPLV